MNTLKFKGFLAERQITQAQLAEVLGLSPQSVNKKVNGKEDFSLAQIKKICAEYGISADEYFL